MQEGVWVGFDMDECLGQFLSLWPFCEILTERLFVVQRNEYLTRVAKRIEESDQHWIFRPGINTVLEMLVRKQNTGKLYGCFILSNNGSQHLVECVRQILNFRAARYGAIRDLFITGWSRNSSCRKGDMKKSLVEIQECLASENLPRARSLIFFDDMRHVLANEIQHYIHVSPYIHYTPVDLVYHILTPVFKDMRISPIVLQAVSRRGKIMETEDLKEDTLHTSSPSSSPWEQAERALKQFFPSTPKSFKTAKETRTRAKTVKSFKTAKGINRPVFTRTRKTAKSRLWTRY